MIRFRQKKRLYKVQQGLFCAIYKLIFEFFVSCLHYKRKKLDIDGIIIIILTKFVLHRSPD